ncbi:3-deoxy-manno-octulosonate cytidylyltransferase [bacterium DOLJORAL78_65_58]|nr:MAG: 3-deoxy-manno-octulosonate cytidylyltransferase [bacterium DOLZORAL124_64_63]PIE76674.1 MAG: 3-deoxy-manno-octulosonate cytidylyltransferase [bacterium DOLJORAL78_65_58]
MSVLVVIPSRYGSSRFPGKSLADVHGRPLVVRTVERAAGMLKADHIVVATDDQRILRAVQAAGHQAEMTGDHPTGTDRIGEVMARHPEAEIILNLQGDEPLLDPAIPDRLVGAMQADARLDIATCAHPFADRAAWLNPHNVKVLVDHSGQALYFSRAALPGCFPGREDRGHELALRHVGLYAFRRKALERFLELGPSALEQAEGLEQLRAMENGMRLKVLVIDQAPVGVDTPEDLELVRKIWRE